MGKRILIGAAIVFGGLLIAFGIADEIFDLSPPPTTKSNPGVISGAWVGCLTKAAHDEFGLASINKDYRQIEALKRRSCFSIDGREFSVVDQGFAVSKIRVFVGNESMVLWVPSEALR